MKKHLDFLSLVNRHQLLPLFLGKVDELLPPVYYEKPNLQMCIRNQDLIGKYMKFVESEEI
jgi:hypothetical protein